MCCLSNRKDLDIDLFNDRHSAWAFNRSSNNYLFLSASFQLTTTKRQIIRQYYCLTHNFIELKMNYSSNNELLTPQQVRTHPSNASSAKQQYSFSKAQRFQYFKTQISTPDIYVPPSTNNHKAIVISKPKRTLERVTRLLTDGPAPNQYCYRVDGQFGGVKAKAVGGYIALGRSDIRTNSFLRSQEGIPSGLEYNPQMAQTCASYSSKHYSFSRQKKFRSTTNTEFYKTGPGKYDVNTSLNQRKQVLSSYHKAPCPKMHDIKLENRKPKQPSEPPIYCPRVTIKGDALDLRRGIRIGKSKRAELKRETTPGPGNYHTFSEFPGRSSREQLLHK